MVTSIYNTDLLVKVIYFDSNLAIVLYSAQMRNNKMHLSQYNDALQPYFYFTVIFVEHSLS